MPNDYNTGHAFELTVTGITDSSYCTQWLKAFNSNKIWVRSQVNWQEPWIWENWEQIPVMSEVMTQGSDGIELGQNLNSSSNYGGYIDFHFNGDTSDYTTRIIEAQSGGLNVTGDFDVKGWLQCHNGFWLAGGGFHIDTSTYGTSLPAAGNAGRIFFKKV